MGIQGLLPLLKSIQKHTHLRDFAGQTLGIDAYGWLHRGTVACAIELAEGKPTRKHIDFTLHRVRMLLHFGVKPYMIFDGDYLPSKAHTETLRAAKRKESKRIGLDLLRMGRSSQAYLELQKAVDVTPLMARELIEELKRLGVPYLVAPYEADSQLAYLEKHGFISGVISEDSDLLVFGVKRLLTKLDQYGECIMVDRADFTACREVSLVGWSDKEFRMMAMLSGCDYLPGLERIGVKTAYRLVRKHKAVERVIQAVQLDGKVNVPAGYLEAFARAEHTFLYQWVFCPERKYLVNLSELPPGLSAEDMPYIGKPVDAEVAAGVACADLDPNTKTPLVLPRNLQRYSTQKRMEETPLGKHGKPISEFFKAKRTPLIELNPNSLTPSPSQQRLLQAATNVSWSASRIANGGVAAAGSSASVGTPLAALQGSRRAISDPRPIVHGMLFKRQRLCDNSSIANAMGGSEGLQATTSPFFNKNVAEATPTQRKKLTRKKDEFELWSDDSVAEALASVTAASEAKPDIVAATPRKKKKLEIYQDNMDYPADSKASGEVSGAATMTTTLTATPQESRIAGTPESALKSRRLFSTYCNLVHQSELNLVSPHARISLIPSKSVSRTKSAPSALTHDQDTSTWIHAGSRNALQPQLKIEENHLSSQSRSSAKTHTPPEGSSPPVGENVIQDEEFSALEERKTDLNDHFQFKGSEDLLVPNSPDDVDADEDLDRMTPKLKLNLGKFVFVG